MITEDSLFHLVHHYHLENNDNCFEEAIDLASNELSNVLDTIREYPVFVYYLCLEHMDKNPKYKFGDTFRRMTDEQKTVVFNETIEELRKLL